MNKTAFVAPKREGIQLQFYINNLKAQIIFRQNSLHIHQLPSPNVTIIIKMPCEHNLTVDSQLIKEQCVICEEKSLVQCCEVSSSAQCIIQPVRLIKNKSGDKNITYKYMGKVLTFPDNLDTVVQVEGDKHAAYCGGTVDWRERILQFLKGMSTKKKAIYRIEVQSISKTMIDFIFHK